MINYQLNGTDLSVWEGISQCIFIDCLLQAHGPETSKIFLRTPALTSSASAILMFLAAYEVFGKWHEGT